MKIRLISCCMLLCSLMSYSQTWQWGQRGGSSDTYTVGPDETVVDMATDPHGNVYVLSKEMKTGLNVGGHTVTGYGSYDILISSFKCDGTYRWSKDIGSNQDDLPVAIKTDTLGGVYVAGYSNIYYTLIHVSTDTTLYSTTAAKGVLLFKFDTSGNYKWLTMPEPDTTSISGAIARTLDLDVDGAGNAYLMSTLPPGAFANGAYIATSKGVYVLHYDRNGNFINGTQLQIGYNVAAVGGLLVKRDHKDGRYYITGSTGFGGKITSLTFNSMPITHALFVGCFNSAGTLLWQKQDVLYGGGFGRADIDAADNIYLTGASANGDTFNTFHVINTYSTLTYSVPFTTKMDSNGNFLWAKNGSDQGSMGCSAVTSTSCATLNGRELAISGDYGGKFIWAGYPDSLMEVPGSGNRYLFTTRFDIVTGAVLGMDSLAQSGVGLMCMAADRFGNFYVGGDFTSALTVNGTTLSSAGGGSDFFVAKYGTANCDTVLVPTLETPPGPLPGQFVLKVYPNPATEELNVTGINQATVYRLLTMTGVAIQQGVLQPGENTIRMRHCAAGIYILEMTGTDGTRNVVRVMKE